MGNKVLLVGEVPSKRLPDLLSSMHDFIKKQAQAKSKDGKKGHSSSPSYISAVLKAVVQSISNGAAMPVTVYGSGGFTDVGDHTGDPARDTAWPLVREVFKVRPAALWSLQCCCLCIRCLRLSAWYLPEPPHNASPRLMTGGWMHACMPLACTPLVFHCDDARAFSMPTAATRRVLSASCPQVALYHAHSSASPGTTPQQQLPPFQALFHKVMALLDVWLLERQVQLLTPATLTPNTVTAAMLMLRSAAGRLGALADTEHDVGVWAARCEAARERIAAVQAAHEQAVGQSFQLPAGPKAWPPVKLPGGTIPALGSQQQQQDGLAAARQRAAANLGSLPLLPPAATFTQALSLLQDPAVWGASQGRALPPRDVVLQHRLALVERLVFGRMHKIEASKLADVMEVEALGVGVGHVGAALRLSAARHLLRGFLLCFC